MNARDPNLPLQPDEAAAIGAWTERRWDEAIVPALVDYIAIPAKSPMFDADWQAHGHIDRVVRDAAQWVEARKVAGLQLEVVRLPGRTPVIFFDAPATKPGSTGTVLLYGRSSPGSATSASSACRGMWGSRAFMQGSLQRSEGGPASRSGRPARRRGRRLCRLRIAVGARGAAGAGPAARALRRPDRDQ